MRAIQKYLPNPKHTETMRIFVDTDTETAWETARHFDASSIPWVKLLFDIRLIPDIISGKKPEIEIGIGVDQITESGKGFMILEEVPGKEVVVGSVGQFWHMSINFAEVKPEDFAGFWEPGWGKLAWAISVEPYLDGSTISLELRTAATDDESWHKLNTYYQLIGPGSYLIREAGLAHIKAALGKMLFPDLNTLLLPGDDLIPGSPYGLTFNTVIEAPISIVWHYLMQLGCDRGGWYSIDLLDHKGKPSVDFIVPDWKTRKTGEKISATLDHDFFFDVLDIEPEKYFIIGGETERLGGPFKMTWTFVLEAVGEDTTHLISRARMESSPKWAEWLMGTVVYPPVHSLMSGVQLKTIKKYAEKEAQGRAADVPLKV
jgi:hypothetical protein